MPKQSGFLSILIVILIAVITLAGGYFVYQKYQSPAASKLVTIQPKPTPSPISDETANWKTYTNPTYNFSLQYPKDWSENNQHDDYGIRKELVSFNRYITVYLLQNPKKLSAIDFIKQLPDYEGGSSVRALSQQPAYFSNLDAVETNGFGGAGNTGNSAYINNGKGNIIKFFTTDISQEIVDQILSTFKFLP